MLHVKELKIVFFSITIFISLTFFTIIIKDIVNDKNYTSTLQNTSFRNKNRERIYMKEFKYLEFDALYDNYVKKHNQIISDLLNPKLKKKNPPKVVVVKPDMVTGYGNRFPGIVCGFLYAIISDRLFFIEGYKNFEDFFLLDFDHNWNSIKNFYNKNSSKYLHNIRNNDFPLITKGNLKDVDSFDILYVRTWDYVCAPIISNPHYKDWIGRIIPDYRVFTAISLRLFRLKLTYVDQIKNFIDNNFGDHNIGIHIRSKKTSLYRMVIPVEHYFQVVKTLLVGIKGKTISIFIASDTNDDRDKLAKLLKSSNHFNNNTINVVYVENDMNIHNPVNFNPGTEANAIVDMKILSFCDDLVITYGSSFGFIAAGWSYNAVSRQRGPYILMPIRNSSVDLLITDKVYVWGATTSEPCMYSSRTLIEKEDKETVAIFKTNPFWLYHIQCHWPSI